MSRYLPSLPILCLLLPLGCADLTQNGQLYQEPPAPWEVEQNNNRLRDISNLIDKGRTNIARQQAEVLAHSQLTLPQQAQFNLLTAQILLSSGEAEQALKKLNAVQAEQLSNPDKIKYLQSKAFANSLTGNLLENAKARIALDEYLNNPTERKNNQAVALDTLGLLTATAMQNQPYALTEWYSAAKILADKNRNPSEFNASLEKWKTAHPNHPANLYMATVSKTSISDGNMPESIALLLPGTGPFADAAKAIKAGFLASHDYYKNNEGKKPELHFYDTEKAKITDLYQQAVNEGANLVIGPLNKNQIQALAGNALLTVPVLALNHVPGLNKANLYQFALSPLDDVAELTKRASTDGHKRALVLLPDNELGKRTYTYLSNNWQALNGTILDTQFYKPGTTDFSSNLKRLLKISNAPGSQAGSAATMTYPQAADVLFLSAYNKEGRIINTQLNNIQASNIAVYALPSIYSGVTDSINDNSLNGVTFCDTPWLFMGGYSGELSMSALHDVWSKYPLTYIRLIAMGLDAYHLAAKLPGLNTAAYAGATGNLMLDRSNRIQRSLMCARFSMGQPQLLGFNQNTPPAAK
jgi:uncharacterized protein